MDIAEEIQNIGADVGDESEISPGNSKLNFIFLNGTSTNITELDISNLNITELPENAILPCQLKRLNISKNLLQTVPAALYNLTKLEYLNISCNKILEFNEIPYFYSTISHLNISKNNLVALPEWVWLADTKNLKCLNVSHNINIVKQFNPSILNYEICIHKLDIIGCNLNTRHKVIFKTMGSLKELSTGTRDCTNNTNYIDALPGKYLNTCHNIETLNLCNSFIFDIDNNINMYKNLKQLNLYDNKITWIPIGFCELHNLEILIMSYNCITFLPDEFANLRQLKYLRLDNNKLCSVPENLCTCLQLEVLDLYNNAISAVPPSWCENNRLIGLDLALNYFEEPSSDKYRKLKSDLRFKLDLNRIDGNKHDDGNVSSSNLCSDSSDKEEFDSEGHISTSNSSIASEREVENWDSDEYWEPYGHREKCLHKSASSSIWTNFIQRKVAEGNFCPVDQHTVPIQNLVQCMNWQQDINNSVDGQYEDLSSESDESL